jgi:hypothetical protein
MRRIDDLIAALSHVTDPGARDAAQQLAEAVLDIHGLALARLMALLAEHDDTRQLLHRLAEDEQIRTVLLLHGLHPDDPATRVGKALQRLGARLAAAGLEARLTYAAAGTASIHILGGSSAPEALRREVEEVIVNAAPDLDEVAIEWADPIHAADAPELAG